MQMASSTAREAQAAAHGVNQYRIQGAVHHVMSSLTPGYNEDARFVQLYIVDPAEAARVRGNFNDALIPQILEQLHTMIQHQNEFGRTLTTAAEYIAECRRNNQPLPHIYCNIARDGSVRNRRNYEAPTGMGVGEVAAFLPDQDANVPHRMLAVRLSGGGLQYIPDTHAANFPLQFPLLFPFGTGGWHPEIAPARGQRQRITLLDWACYHLHERPGRSNAFLMARRLLHEFMVVTYCAVEAQRLLFIRQNQSALRADQYQEVAAAVQQGEPHPTVTLP
jgi:hypothetical protein